MERIIRFLLEELTKASKARKLMRKHDKYQQKLTKAPRKTMKNL